MHIKHLEKCLPYSKHSNNSGKMKLMKSFSLIYFPSSSLTDIRFSL